MAGARFVPPIVPGVHYNDVKMDYSARYMAMAVTTVAGQYKVQVVQVSAENLENCDDRNSIAEKDWKLYEYVTSDKINRIAFSACKFGCLAACLTSGHVLIFQRGYDNHDDDRLESSEWGVVMRSETHRKGVHCIAFALQADKPVVACGSRDGRVSVVQRTEEGEDWQISVTAERAHPGGCGALAWCPNGAALRLVTGGFDKVLKIWSFDGHALVPEQELRKEHSAVVRSVFWFEDDKRDALASGSADGRVLFWSKNADGWAVEEVAKFGDAVYLLETFSNGPRTCPDRYCLQVCVRKSPDVSIYTRRRREGGREEFVWKLEDTKRRVTTSDS